jgi:hypothetical protein
MDYQIVFTATDLDFGIAHIGPVFLFVGSILFMFVIFRMKIKDKNSKRFAQIFSIVFVLAAIGIMFSQTPDRLNELHRFERIFEEGAYKTVEGEISNFEEYREEGKGYWINTFKVRDVDFFLQSNDRYNAQSTHKGIYYEYPAKFNGPIKQNGQEVRISYIHENEMNKIIKVEVKRRSETSK